MTHFAKVSDAETAGRDTPGMDMRGAVQCPLPARPQILDAVTSDLCRLLAETDCPLAFPVHEHLRFETLLAELSGTFVNLPPSQVDTQIEIDVHDQKQVEEALRAKEQSLRQTREGLRRLAAKLLHAQEEERRRIAREMHDDWTQRLALLGIDFATLEKNLGTPEKALPLLHTMREQLVGLAEDVHALSRQLHPSILDDLGLVEALRSECASFSRREGVTVVYRPEQVPATLPKDVALCVYRVAQEALRNLAKHAAVSQAWVTLVATGSELVLRVQDQGVGFDPEGARSQLGLGLSSMEERVRLIEAKLSVVSAPGHGTTVEVRAPLARSNS